MSKSPERSPVLTENNDRVQRKKRRRCSSSSDSSDSSVVMPRKRSKTNIPRKRWRGTTSSEFQPELLEEMGVGMLSGVSEEEKSVTEILISSSEGNENVNSNMLKPKKVMIRKRRKRQSLNYVRLKNSKKGVKCMNNNSPAGDRPILDDSSTVDKEDASEKPKVEREACDRGRTLPSDESDDCCRPLSSGSFAYDSDDSVVEASDPSTLRNGSEGSATKRRESPRKEDSDGSGSSKKIRNLKWEKMKPISCKIRNSKIIYQYETKETEKEADKVRSKGEQGNRGSGERTEEDDSDFFLSRRPKVPVSGGEDHFYKLSDEVILSIFRWLPKKTLVTCALVCKRFRRLAYDEALWTRMDLARRNLSPKSVGYIVSRGFRILRLAQAALPDPVYCPLSSGLPPGFVSKLQYLDLSMATISANGLAVFMNFCRFLKKLSLENCQVNNACCTAIAKNPYLEVLNLTMCVGLTTAGIDSILSNCRRLQSLNIAWTGLSGPALNAIACKVPSGLERLNISGNKKTLTDEHIIEIFHRCENLIELDVSDSMELTEQVIDFIVKYVDKIEYLSFSRCYSIPTASFLSLKQVQSLMFLDVFGLMMEDELNELKSEFTNVAINQFPFSSVARPTVGLRRTSIWGLQVRD